MDFDIPFFPEQASTIAGLTDLFTFGVIGLGLFIGTLVVIVIFYFSVHYKAGSDADRSNPVDEHTALELTWSFIPLVLVLAIFVWSASIYFDLYNPPPDTLDLYVIGKQWMWKVQHPDGQREVNTMHIPVNQPVKVTMTSQDVIHSFYIPDFRIKQDALPGRYTSIWFEATKLGEYHILCAEYCGTEHALMVGKVIVMSPADYEQWLRDNAGSGGAVVSASGTSGSSDVGGIDAGKAIFEQLGCETCHKLDGSVGVGPSLVGEGPEVELDTGEMVPYDEEYIRESIIDPGAKLIAGYSNMMPSYQGQLSDEDMISLVQYIKSISASGADETSSATTEEPAEAAESSDAEETAAEEAVAEIIPEELFSQAGCEVCHKLDGSAGLGPSLIDVGTDVELDSGEVVSYDADYIRQSIIDPSSQIVSGYANVMPTTALSDEELDIMVEFVLSINVGE